MDFEEWYSKPDLPYIEHYLAKLVWNAALDEAVKVAKKASKDNYKSRGWVDCMADDIAEAIEDLKDE